MGKIKMSARTMQSEGISEVGAGIMIIILVVVLAIVAYLALFGSLNPAIFKKSAYIAGTAAAFETQLTGNPQIVTFLPQAGDPFYFTGQYRNVKGANVTLRLTSPDGQVLYPNTSTLSGQLYGKTLYIYPKISAAATQCDYQISDSVPGSAFRPMVVGCWTLQTIDTEIPVLIDTYHVDIKDGRASLPSACGFIASPTEKFFRADCTAINQTVKGNITACNSTPPGGMACSHLNSSAYVSVPNDPTLSFTGNNLALSMWINPNRAVASTSDTSNWYTLIGKGQLFANGTEFDNYQMTQIGNKIYFEWTDPVAGKHFHVMTTSSPITANAWTQVTVTITNGVLSLYTNCVEQPISYYQSNYPTDTAAISPVKVNLSVNNNNFLVGKQNADDPANSFYFSGDMAGISVYNRGLSGAEISNACSGSLVC
jgi:hypothetical protein